MFCWWGFWLAMGFLRDSSLPGAGTRREFFQGLPPCSILCNYLSGWSFLTSVISLEVGISEKWDLFVCLLFRGFGLAWFGFPAELARTRKLFIGGVFGKRGTTWLERSSFLGITPRPRQCRCQVLTAGLSGDFPGKPFKDLIHFPSFLESQRPESCCSMSFGPNKDTECFRSLLHPESKRGSIANTETNVNTFCFHSSCTLRKLETRRINILNL